MKFKQYYILLFFIPSTLCFAADNLKINKNDALFSVFDQTLPIVTAKYVGWAKNWKWANTSVKADHTTQLGRYQRTHFTSQAQNLNIKFQGTVTPNTDSVTWTYDWQKNADIPGAIGFGIEFNLQLNAASFSKAAQAPELLPANQGWRWQTPDGQSVEVVFTPPLDKIYFERGQKNKIRAFFFSGISSGAQQTTMTVKISDQIKIEGPDVLKYGAAEIAKWPKNILADLSSPVDLSFLNHVPAGKHGFVKTNHDQLMFEDGTPAKFWGANLQGAALFSTSDFDIKRHAKRMAKLGLNLIRIHHHDSDWVKPNIFKRPADNTLELSESAFKKLDWWIKCLKDEGIYVWLDLHVGRKVTPHDGIGDFNDFAKGQSSAGIKGFNYYNESIQSAMQTFNQAYLNHINQFTGLAYKEDPAVIALLITNENDLTQHFGNALLPNKGVPRHSALFTHDVKQFTKKHRLPYNKTWQTWQMGESKIYLNDAEHRFNRKMIAHLHQLDANQLIATTNSWGRMGIFGLPSLTDGELIDAHSYGRAEEFNFNPRHNPGFLTWVGAAQVSGKPLSVSEWNIEPFPAPDRFTAPVYTAAIADLQGWDAMMLYGYSQTPLGKWSQGSNYSTFNDPAIIGLMPAAALLYRQNHVAPAKQTYELKLTKHDFFFEKIDPTTSKSIRTLLESSRLTIAMPNTPELPWLKDKAMTSKNAIVITDPDNDFIPAGQNFVTSDTGELKRNWQKGIHTINTAKSQIASGWIGGEAIKLNDVSFDLATPKAVVAIQSLDDRPINQSNKIFISALARSQPSNGNKLPFLSEPVVGNVTIRAPKGLRLYPITATGTRADPVTPQYSDGKYKIELAADQKNHWYIMSAK